MKKIILILLLLNVLYAKEIDQKMVLSTHLEVNKAAQSLYELEIFFRENSFAKEIKANHHLSLQMELLEQYVLVTLKPIETASLKNKLQYLFQEYYPQNFIVNDTRIQKIRSKEKAKVQKVENEIVKKETVVSPKVEPIKEVQIVQEEQGNSMGTVYEKVNTFWKTLDLEWVGLLILALAGFLLVYRSAKQISKIKTLQQKVETYQNKVENEIDSIGDKDA